MLLLFCKNTTTLHSPPVTTERMYSTASSFTADFLEDFIGFRIVSLQIKIGDMSDRFEEFHFTLFYRAQKRRSEPSRF